jgi:NAD-dependent DNA ligase
MIIENCPSCGSKLVYVKDQLFCKNKTDCPAQSSKAVEHYCKTLKIKGLGPKRIEALELSSISDIYDLTEDFIAEQLGDKVAATIMAEIEKARNVDFATFLAGCGVPLVGNSVSTKLAEVVNTLDEINADTCSKAGLGAKATQNLVTWLESGFEMPYGVSFNQPKQKQQKTGSVSVCISGKISGYTKAQATVLLNEEGFDVKNTITKDVKILITEQTGTAKVNQAKELGLPIGTLEDVLTHKIIPSEK